MSRRIKVLWALMLLFIVCGVMFSLKYTATSRPVPKIKLSFSSELRDVGRYNYLRLWPELEKASVIVLGVNQDLSPLLKEQWLLWLGFLREAHLRGKRYSIFVDSDLTRSEGNKNKQMEMEVMTIELIVEKIEEHSERTDLGRKQIVFIMSSQQGLKLSRRFDKKIEFLGVWPLMSNRDEFNSFPYSCLKNAPLNSHKKEDLLSMIGCEVQNKSISLFRKVERKIKQKGKKGWLHATDHVSRGRYNIYLMSPLSSLKAPRRAN